MNYSNFLACFNRKTDAWKPTPPCGNFWLKAWWVARREWRTLERQNLVRKPRVLWGRDRSQDLEIWELPRSNDETQSGGNPPKIQAFVTFVLWNLAFKVVNFCHCMTLLEGIQMVRICGENAWPRYLLRSVRSWEGRFHYQGPSENWKLRERNWHDCTIVDMSCVITMCWY